LFLLTDIKHQSTIESKFGEENVKAKRKTLGVNKTIVIGESKLNDVLATITKAK